MNRQNLQPIVAAIAAWILYILNLLLPGVFLGILFIVWLLKRNNDSGFVRAHVKQAFAGASLTTTFFFLIYIAIAPMGGYRSMEGLIGLEFYFMALVPLFFIPGLLALMKVFSGGEFQYPVIGQFVKR